MDRLWSAHAVCPCPWCCRPVVRAAVAPVRGKRLSPFAGQNHLLRCDASLFYPALSLRCRHLSSSCCRATPATLHPPLVATPEGPSTQPLTASSLRPDLAAPEPAPTQASPYTFSINCPAILHPRVPTLLHSPQVLLIRSRLDFIVITSEYLPRCRLPSPLCLCDRRRRRFEQAHSCLCSPISPGSARHARQSPYAPTSFATPPLPSHPVLTSSFAQIPCRPASRRNISTYLP